MSGAETLKLVELNPLRTCLVTFMAGMQGTLGQRGICKNRCFQKATSNAMMRPFIKSCYNILLPSCLSDYLSEVRKEESKYADNLRALK